MVPFHFIIICFRSFIKFPPELQSILYCLKSLSPSLYSKQTISLCYLLVKTVWKAIFKLFLLFCWKRKHWLSLGINMFIKCSVCEDLKFLILDFVYFYLTFYVLSCKANMPDPEPNEQMSKTHVGQTPSGLL
jgi:hypothetical protein